MGYFFKSIPVQVRRWLVFTGMGSAYAASILDTTIVHLALPTINRQFAADLMTSSWIVHSYNIVFAATLITAGKLADAYGHKRVLLTGISLFSLSSLFCAFAPSLLWLILFRGLQAMGGASLGAVGFAVVGRIFPPEQRTLPLSIWSAIAALAAILGPMLGAVALAFTWHWIFLINLPICLLALMLTSLLPKVASRQVPQQFDLTGMLFCALFLIALILLLIEEWNGISLVVLLVLIVLSLAGLVVVERTSAAPFLDFSLFRLRSFRASSLGMFVFWLAYQGATLILSLYLLGARHLPAQQAALFIIPVPLANVALSLLLQVQLPMWVRTIVGLGCGTLGFLGLSALSTAPLWLIVFPTLLIGASASLCFISFHACVLSEVPQPKLGQASGVFNTARQLATTLGAALLLRSISWTLQAQFIPLEHSVQATMQVATMTQIQRIQATRECEAILSSLLENQGSRQTPQIHLLSNVPWDTWFSQQLQGAISSAFAQTWLLCAAIALATLPLAMALRPRQSPKRAGTWAPLTHTRKGEVTHATTRS